DELTALSAGVFDSLTQLTELYLHYNQLTTLPYGVFDRQVHLQELGLHPGRNQLKSVPDGVFPHLLSFTHVWLNTNSWD
uniref:Variable lymphocyte receptor B cassette n=1 Tax=Petromyzon marinus TaxID=7757 RepID=S4RFC5_PETMA